MDCYRTISEIWVDSGTCEDGVLGILDQLPNGNFRLLAVQLLAA
jgi:hypothetical protein